MNIDECILIALHAHKTGSFVALSLGALTRAVETLLDAYGPVNRRSVEQALARAEGAQRIRLVSPGGKGPRNARSWELLEPCVDAYDVPGYLWVFAGDDLQCNGVSVSPVNVLQRLVDFDGRDGTNIWLRAVGAFEWARAHAEAE